MHVTCRFATAAATIVILLAQPTPAPAQESLDDNIMRTEGRLDPDQQDAIRDFVDDWTARLTAADASIGQIAEARRKLIEPLRVAGATDSAKDFYSTELAAKLRPALEAARNEVRLNGTVILGSMYRSTGLALAQSRMVDAVPAIRYWATKAVADALDNDQVAANVPEARRGNLLNTLKAVVPNEESTDVRRQQYLALVLLQTPQSWSFLIDNMSDYALVMGRKGPSEALAPVRAAMTKLQGRLVYAKVQAGDNAARIREIQGQMHDLAVAALKYAQILARAKELDPATQAIGLDMVKTIEPILVQAQTNVAPNWRIDDDFELTKPFNQGKMVKFQWVVNNWIELYTTGPMSVKPQELQVPQPTPIDDEDEDDAD